MIALKRFWRGFRNFAILFSFIVNFVLIIVLLVVLTLLFQIKTGIAEPLVNGLYASFTGLNEARILTNINVKDTIVVRDTIPVKLNIPLQQNTVVTLTEPVNLNANANFTLPGGGGSIRGSVAITLPAGLNLPVALNLNVPVDSPLPVELKVPIDLNVPVDIPLKDTQLNDVAVSLRNVVLPFVNLLNNLPDDWLEVWPLIGQILAGRGPNLLAPSDFAKDPGFKFETGLGLPTPAPSGKDLIPIQPAPGTSNTTPGGSGPASTPTEIGPQPLTAPPATPTLFIPSPPPPTPGQ
jgi:hypothetical protein